MKRLLSFDEFVNEQYDNFDPTKTTGEDPIAKVLASVDELTPGKEYCLTIDGVKNCDMLYQGVTYGSYIFNGEDKAHDIALNAEQIQAAIDAKGIEEVAE
jgi:hypothetical protein